MEPISEITRETFEGQNPIYEIIMIQYCDRKAIGSNGKELDWPNHGIVESVGYYYEYETAVRALHENWADIQDGGTFSGAWIERKFPGLYPWVRKTDRTFFRWDNELEGYFEDREPDWWNE